MEKRLTMILTLLLLSLGTVMAQTIVSGTVVSDEDSEPIIGAVVKMKGQKSALAVTDIDGKFSFSTSRSGSTFEVTSVGYVTTEIRAGQNLLIRMKPGPGPPHICLPALSHSGMRSPRPQDPQAYRGRSPEGSLRQSGRSGSSRI